MKVAHFAPFAPNRCGMYEAARDFVRADILRGHDAYFVDTGATTDGTFQGYAENPKDERAGFIVPIVKADQVLDADMIVAHTGIPDDWIKDSKAPIIWILHGRPLDCFRPEQNGSVRKAYSLLHSVSRRPRVKKLVTMWEEHYPYWEVNMPHKKLVCIDPPPMDGERFSNTGVTHVIADHCKGAYNLMFADSWRDDVDIFEIMNGAILAAQRIPGLKIHNFATETKKGSTNVVEPWNLVFDYTKKLGIQGEIWGRLTNMEQIYRSMDMVLTPHRIVTRIIGEATCCGVPVVAGGSRYTKWNCRPEDPYSVADAISSLVYDLNNDKKGVKEYLTRTADKFSLARWGERINKIYEEVA